jgi:hypothetical protein
MPVPDLRLPLMTGTASSRGRTRPGGPTIHALIRVFVEDTCIERHAVAASGSAVNQATTGVAPAPSRASGQRKEAHGLVSRPLDPSALFLRRHREIQKCRLSAAFCLFEARGCARLEKLSTQGAVSVSQSLALHCATSEHQAPPEVFPRIRCQRSRTLAGDQSASESGSAGHRPAPPSVEWFAWLSSPFPPPQPPTSPTRRERHGSAALLALPIHVAKCSINMSY